MSSPEIERPVSFEERQLEAEKFMRKMQPAIEFANLRLEQAYHHDREILPEVAQEVIEEFDNQWLYHNEEFLVIGKWWAPEFTSLEVLEHEDDDPTDDSGGGTVLDTSQSQNRRLYPFSISVGEEEVIERALSRGFSITTLEGLPQVAFMFERRGTHTIVVPGYAQIQANFYAQASPRDVSLQYLGPPPDDDQIVDSLQAITSELDLSEALHKLYIKEPNFYRLPAKRQQRLMSGLVERVNRLINLSDPVTVELKASTTLLSNSDGVHFDAVEHDTKFLTLRGNLAGVDLVNRPVLENGVTAPYQLISPEAGLCLDLVDLEEPTPEPIIERKVAHVVFRSIKTLQLSLSS